MKNSFWGLIWKNFLEIQGLWIGFLGIIITLILARFPFKTPIPLDLVIVMVFFTLLFIFTLLYTVNSLLTQKGKLESELEGEIEQNQNLVNELNKLKIHKILRVQKEQNTGEILCLFDNSDLFADQLMISVFYRDEYGFEASIGVGYIKSIQSNNKIQAVIDQPVSSYQDILDRLVNNDQLILEQTIVRPGTPKKFNQS